MASWKTIGTSLGAIATSLLTLSCCLPLPFLGAAGIAGRGRASQKPARGC